MDPCFAQTIHGLCYVPSPGIVLAVCGQSFNITSENKGRNQLNCLQTKLCTYSTHHQIRHKGLVTMHSMTERTAERRLSVKAHVSIQTPTAREVKRELGGEINER